MNSKNKCLTEFRPGLCVGYVLAATESLWWVCDGQIHKEGDLCPPDDHHQKLMLLGRFGG